MPSAALPNRCGTITEPASAGRAPIGSLPCLDPGTVLDRDARESQMGKRHAGWLDMLLGPRVWSPEARHLIRSINLETAVQARVLTSALVTEQGQPLPRITQGSNSAVQSGQGTLNGPRLDIPGFRVVWSAIPKVNIFAEAAVITFHRHMHGPHTVPRGAPACRRRRVGSRYVVLAMILYVPLVYLSQWVYYNLHIGEWVSTTEEASSANPRDEPRRVQLIGML